MAINILELTVDINGAFVAGGAIPGNPLLIAMSGALAQAFVKQMKAAEVDPIAPPPGGPMISPSGPVTGFGKLR